MKHVDWRRIPKDGELSPLILFVVSVWLFTSCSSGRMMRDADAVSRVTTGGQSSSWLISEEPVAPAPAIDALPDEGPPAEPKAEPPAQEEETEPFEKPKDEAVPEPSPEAQDTIKSVGKKAESPPTETTEEPKPPGLEDKTLKDYGADCARSGCHAVLIAVPKVHSPECVECHKPTEEVTAHKFELAHAKEDLCEFCHEPPEAQKVVHEPYAESDCLGCHDPHGGTTRAFVISEKPTAFCVTCHEPKEKNEVLHGPFAVGACLVCHAAHQSQHESLLVQPGRDLCVSCHSELEEVLGEMAYAHGPATTECSVCHASHGSSHEFLLRKDSKSLCVDCHDSFMEKLEKDSHVHGALDDESGCSRCHTAHASQFKSQLRSVAGELCLSCHDREIAKEDGKRKIGDIAKEIAAGQYKHGPVDTGDCQGCHFSHSSSHAFLLREDYPRKFYAEFAESNYSLCFECHEKTLVRDERTTTLTGFRDGDRNLHYLHVNRKKGRTCRSCHATHASNHPKHIRESVPFGSMGWELPIQFEKTETGGKCTPGCHKVATYDNLASVPEDAAGRDSQTGD